MDCDQCHKPIPDGEPVYRVKMLPTYLYYPKEKRVCAQCHPSIDGAYGLRYDERRMIDYRWDVYEKPVPNTTWDSPPIYYKAQCGHCGRPSHLACPTFPLRP